MKLFGTDGLRGRAGHFPLDAASVRLVGEEVAKRCRGPREGNGATVVLGGDPRESTPGLLARLDEGISRAGSAAARAGVIPTPGVAELVLALSAGAGVSVSASHNPFEDNGIKIFGPDGRKWPDREEERLEEILLAARGTGGETRGRADAETRREGEATGGGREVDPRLAEMYLARLAEHVPARLRGMAVVLDTGHGAAYRLGPAALERAGARVAAMANHPDGRNINDGCGALHPEGMAAKTRETAAAMGVALDGDADRAILADENGLILDGDDVLWIVASEFRRRGILSAGGIVGTVMSNFGLERALSREGIPFHRAAVGDRNVSRLMEETGATLGGETSGHILLPFTPAGDGIQTALAVASIVSESARPLSSLATLEKTPQVLRNVRVERRVPIEELPEISEALARAEMALERKGRVFLRYSGTEPLLRILVEGSDGDRVVSIADELEAVVRRAIP